MTKEESYLTSTHLLLSYTSYSQPLFTECFVVNMKIVQCTGMVSTTLQSNTVL